MFKYKCPMFPDTHQPCVTWSQNSRIYSLPFGRSYDAVGVSYLGRQWVGKWGQVAHWRCRVENGALRPPLPAVPSCGCWLIVWSQNVFSTLAPCLSPQPNPCTCLDIICLFRPHRTVFLCQS